jgi:predicted RNA-binding Zn ribbon-like protein
MSSWQTSPASHLDRRGGHVAVDFVNTVAWRGDPQRRVDNLYGYGDLLAWSLPAGLIDRVEVDGLAAAAEADLAAAARVLRRARRLREALHGLWTGTGADAHLKTIEDDCSRGLRARELRLADDRVRWVGLQAGLATPVWRIAVEAVDLLTAYPLSDVKACHSRACGWLFLDHSRRGNRKWCSASDCGNRARVRDHYDRTRPPAGRRP